MKSLQKISIWLLPVLVLLLIFITFSAKQLINLDQSPVKGWSRSIALPIKNMSDQAALYTQTIGNNTRIYGETKKGIVALTVNPAFQTVSSNTISVHPDSGPFWAKNQRLVYIKNGKLIDYKNGKEHTADPQATLLLPLKNRIIYASDKTLKQYIPATGQHKTIAKFDLSINELNKSANNNDFSVATNQDKLTKVYYFKNMNGSYKKYFVHSFNDQSSYNGFLFSVKGNTLHFIYSRTTYANGATTNYFVTDVPIKSLNGTSRKLNENIITIYKGANHDLVQSPNDVGYSVINGQDRLIFSAAGSLSYKHDGQIIYTAPLNGTIATAVPHSTNSLSIRPIVIHPGQIAWLGFDSNETYQLFSASTNAKATADSLAVTKGDIGNATSNALILMSINILIIFYAFLYTLPAFVYYFSCYFIRPYAVENGSRVVWWGTYIIYFAFQFVFLFNFLVPKLIDSKLPAYLHFPGSAYLAALILSLISWAITRFAKTEFWEPLPTLFYYVAINTIFITMFLGGYTFPT